MNDDKIKIVNDLVEDARNFYSKAKTYKQYEELEGCLINMMLSANNLYQAVKILDSFNPNDASNSSIKLLTKDKESGYYDTKKECNKASTICKDELNTILNNILNEIKPLQIRLRDVKSSGGSGGGSSSSGKKDEQETDCKDIKDLADEIDDFPMYKDVIGCDEAKAKLLDTFEKPFDCPNLYKDKTRAILLYGPPGTGKTMIAKAAVRELMTKREELQIHFFAPMAADLKGKYVGDTEKKIKGYFECASRAACEAENAGKESGNFKRHLSILFLDEVEAIATSRGDEQVGASMTSSVNTLLQMMDGVSMKPNVIIIAATNYPWKLDGAFLRRFQGRILIDLPKAEDIAKLILLGFSKFLSLNFDESLGNWEDKEFKPNSEKGVLLLKKKMGNGRILLIRIVII